MFSGSLTRKEQHQKLIQMFAAPCNVPTLYRRSPSAQKPAQNGTIGKNDTLSVIATLCLPGATCGPANRLTEAYGWGDDWSAGLLTEDEILSRLFS